MEINKNGFWENPTSEGHFDDFVLLKEIKRIITENNIKSVVDFGCGTGFYVKYLKDIVSDVNCFDGNPYTSKLTHGLCKVLDLTKSFDIEKKFDCVISLEVGEHIPNEYETIFLDNLTTHSNDIILLSWAIPNQHGIGHVNCKDNQYIIDKMIERGFEYNDEESQKVRNNKVVWWFKNTFMFFRKKK
jgi:SAM-dependent methyltransferase